METKYKITTKDALQFQRFLNANLAHEDPRTGACIAWAMNMLQKEISLELQEIIKQKLLSLAGIPAVSIATTEEIPISALRISFAAEEYLRTIGIDTVTLLEHFTVANLCNMKPPGKKILRELEEELRNIGKEFADPRNK